ncbi:MAG: glycosyltransferase family 2 protein [bacterium]
MFLSIVILNWNRPDDTIQAVGSVTRQDFSDYEVIVWDNCSNEASKELLRGQLENKPRVRLVWGDANYGVAGGRNRSFRLARGDAIVSLDSDAIFERNDSLRIIADSLQGDPAIGCISFEVRKPNGHLAWPFARPAGVWKDRTFDTSRCDGCAFAVRRNVFEQVNGFPEHFSPYGAEDAYFALSIIGGGYRVLYLPDVKIIHAVTPRARTGAEFTKHVRNHLWMRMELFPFPHAALSASNVAVSLLRDAWEQGQMGDYAKGIFEAVTGFRTGRRRPLPAAAWRLVRDMVGTERRLAAEAGAGAASART